MSAWTYLPLPWPGAKINNGGDDGSGPVSTVFALRVSATGMAEVMDGTGRWWRVGKETTDRYGYSHDGTLTVTTAYTHGGDL